MLDSKPRLLPDSGQRVGHAEFLGFGSHHAKDKRRVHPLDLTESGHLSQLQLDKKTHNIKRQLLLKNMFPNRIGASLMQ